MVLRELAATNSKLFLKSEYGPLSERWPVVSFTVPALKNLLNREYLTGRDFIIYTGTSGEKTRDSKDRSRLLSVAEIDRTRTYETSKVIPAASWEEASRDYPGQWEHAFRVLRGWNITDRPSAKELIGSSYAKLGFYPYRSTALEVQGADREALLDLTVDFIPNLDKLADQKMLDVPTLLRPENRVVSQEAQRLADLVFSRVQLSGQAIQRVAPIRNAPTDLFLQIANLLNQAPLICALCGGHMELRPPNRLLQPSGDRKDSSLGDYGPQNFQLVHLACNLGKNSCSDVDFQEWIEVIRGAVISESAPN